MILTILDGTGTGTGSGGSGGSSSRRRYLQIGLLALALLLVAVLGFRQIQRLIKPEKEIWVASSDLPAGSTIGAQNLRKIKMAESALPKGAIADARALTGRELARPKEEGETFLRDDFATSTEQLVSAAELVPEGRVLTTVRIPKGLVPYKNLKNGDRVDLISVGSTRAGGFADVIVRDAYVIGMIQTVEPKPAAQQQNGLAALVAQSTQRQTADPTFGLILALHPEDAVPLAQAIGRTRLQVVLHGKTEVTAGQLLELPEHDVEFIAGSTKQRLVVTP